MEKMQKIQEKAGSVDPSYKAMMDIRLEETMAEAKRHYQSYLDIRQQYNCFVEGRLNQMIDHCKTTNDTPSSSSIKSNKIKSDLIQTLKVNLEVQDSMVREEMEKQKERYGKVEVRIKEKDEKMGKMAGKIKSLQEEIERRQFIEKKVQTYVKTLCGQNEKLKKMIKEELPDRQKVLLQSVQLQAEESENEEEYEENDEN